MNFIQSELEILVYWIKARDTIRCERVMGFEKPWTTDPLLQGFRWCNVRRMDDKVSQWLLKNWYLAGDPLIKLVDATMARLINWPDSLAEIISECPDRNLDVCRIILHARDSRDEKVFTGAYIVPGVAGSLKVDSVMNTVELVSEQCSEILRLTAKETWTALKELPGLGSFLAGQIIADAAHHSDWPDSRSWAPLGPGSQRGMNRLLGRPKNQRISQEQFEEELAELMCMDSLRQHIADIWDGSQLCAMDIQNCLCEFDKYRRLTLKEGLVRATYPGTPKTFTQLIKALDTAVRNNRKARRG